MEPIRLRADARVQGRRGMIQWVVCYDSADDARRNRLVKVLLDYGQRVQESVFWVEAEDDLAERIRERLTRVIDVEEDSLWIVPLCAACAKRVEVFGKKGRPVLPEFYIF